MNRVKWAILLSLFLSSCCFDETTTKTKDKVFFNHYFSFTGTEKSLDGVASGFNSTTSTQQLILNGLDHESFKTSILKDTKGNNPADLYSYWAGAKTKALVKNLLPIDDIWQQQSLDKQFPKNIIDSASSYGGHKYLLPITQHYVSIFYNKKIFDRLKLTPPKTWEEFLKICEILKDNKITPISLGAKSKWPAQFWFDYLLLETAGYKFRQQLMEGEIRYTDQAVLNVFKIWKSLLDKGYFNKNSIEIEWDTGAANQLVKGEAGMTLMGSWIMGYFSSKEVNFKPGIDYDFFPFPIINKNLKRSAVGPIDGVVIPLKAKNIAGAKEVITHFSKEQTLKEISRITGCLVPTVNNNNDFYNVVQHKMVEQIKSLPLWAFNYDLATPPLVSAIGLTMFEEFLAFPNFYQEIVKSTAQKIDDAFTSVNIDEYF